MSKADTPKKERIAKVLARAGVGSRREVERMIAAGRIQYRGKTLTTPAFTVAGVRDIQVDGRPVESPEPTTLWRYHKPAGLVTSHHDPQGRPTVFDRLPGSLGRVISVGRLDVASEGLLLLTNDGELARQLELPSTGWKRRYRARVYGRVDPVDLAALEKGLTVDGFRYGAIEAALERQQGANAWITVNLREGKNREVRRVLDHLGLKVNRLIRISYGPFQLGDLPPNGIDKVPRRILRDQAGHLLKGEAP